jgi:cytochrome c oxidase subunit 3
MSDEAAATPGAKHEMHLPHGSAWPFWLALSIALLCVGMIFLGQSLNLSDPNGAHVPSMFSLAMVGIGFLAVVGTLVGWITQDHAWWQTHTGTGEHVPKAGILLFIGSEVFLFGALFANYFTFKSTSHSWPDTDLELPVLKTAFFSLFLFASSATVHMAEHHLKRGHRTKFLWWWFATIVLGAIFLGGQVSEYANLIREGHTLGSSQFMTAFFILTGTHGLHVFGGLCLLTIMFVRGALGQFDATRHAGPQAASMYWHFVDIVWVFVFGIVYLMNIHGPLFG